MKQPPKKRMILFLGQAFWVFLILFGLGFSPGVRAEFTLLPESRHQQYLTYALFTEEHTSLLLRDSGRAWGAVAGGIALLEAPDWRWRPQLIVHASANASFRLNASYAGLLTDTIDARAGLAVEMALRQDLRLSIGWTHYSGHIADNVPDKDLIGSNLGDEFLPIRLIYDGHPNFRAGGTLKPLFSSDPKMLLFAADQFIEWFPFGNREAEKAGTPFVSLGADQMGRNHLVLSTNAMIGCYLGSHLMEKHGSAARAVLGYYQGWNPALKYAEFKDSQVQFVYSGLMVDF